ncbi:MAG: STAS domain-containing protein [SAR324 cluster bacterium]|nr:STAS domain-containing protein [SAR324 cluster bacterium]
MNLSHEIKGEVCVISIENQVGEGVGLEFKNYIGAILLKDDTIKNFILDFEKAKSIDSRGIGVIASTIKVINKREGGLVFCGVPPEIFKIFSIVKLDKIIKFFPGREEALASF